MSDLTKKSFLNFLASLVKTGGILALTFILTPVLIKLIGSKDFGTFKVLTEIYSYLSLAEMGLMTAVVTSMLPFVRSKDRQKVSEIMAQGSWRFYKVIMWTVVFGICMMPFLEKLTSWDKGNPFDLYITFSIMLFTSITIPSNIYRAYLESQNKGYLVHLIIFFQNTLFTLLSVFFAYRGLGLKSQALGLLISLVVGAALLRILSDIKVDLSKRENAFRSIISKHQTSQVLNELAGKLCWQIDQIVIASMIDTIMVTKVFIGQRLALIMQQQLLALGQASWASLSSLYYGENQRETFEARFYEMTKFLAYGAVVLLVPVCLLNRAFINLWIGSELLMDNDQLIYIASANAFLHGIFSFWGHIITVLGKANLLTKPFWIQAVLNVIVSILSTHFLGGVGPILGTLVSYALIPLLIYPFILNKNFNLRMRPLYQSLILPMALGCAAVVAILSSTIELQNLSLVEFIIKGFAIFSINAIIMFVIIFNQTEKMNLIKRIRTILARWI